MTCSNMVIIAKVRNVDANFETIFQAKGINYA